MIKFSITMITMNKTNQQQRLIVQCKIDNGLFSLRL